MLDYLRDLVKHTNNLGVQVIKVTGDSAGNVILEGMEDDKTVVIKGKFLKSIPEFEGVCGLGQLDQLNNILNIYSHKDDEIEVKRENRKFSMVVKDDKGDTVLDGDGSPTYEEVEEDVIGILLFKRDSAKMKNPYRITDKRQIADQFDFLGATWDVEIEPTQSAIDMLGKQSGIGFSETFGVKTEDGNLFIVLGDPALQASFLFAKDVVGEMTNPWTWDLGKVLSILKLSSNAECSMRFLDKGLLQITLNTGQAEYNYILPAKAR